MLNDTVIVQSAISAFNNAALVSPAFLWWTLLAIPLFVIVFWFSAQIRQRLQWNSENIISKSAVWIAGLTGAWVVLMGGNYAVLRDNTSVLPETVAVIVFLATLMISSHTRTKKLPKTGWKQWGLIAIILGIIAMSDTHAWWGPLLQIAAVALGFALGRVAKADMRPVAGTLLITTTTTVAMLMQPEFFRFGQLGQLSAVHLIALLMFGMATAVTVALTNFRPKNAIRRGVFIKIKWLMRVMCALGIALFLLTEAIPVYLGTMVAVMMSCALSIMHAQKIHDETANKIFAVAMGTFGTIAVMPAVVAIAILIWTAMPQGGLKADLRQLL